MENNKIPTQSVDNLAAVNQDNEISKTEISTLPSDSASISFEDFVSSGFDSFTRENPGVSKECLINDSLFKEFFEGVKSASLSSSYSQFCNFVSKIQDEAIKKERARQSNANASVGVLSNNVSSEDTYFTKEQVLKMSPKEIKKHYNRIRESQATW